MSDIDVAPENPWTDRDFFIAHAHIPNRQLAFKYGGGESSWRKWRGKHGIPNADKLVAPLKETQKPEVPEATPEERVESDRRLVKLRKEHADLKKKYDAAIRDSLVTEEVLDLAREILPRLAPYDPPTFIRSEKKLAESAVAGWADWHCDEIIDAEVMEGLNEFNPSIAARRVECMVDSTLSLLHDHHSGTTFDEMHVLDVGDGITGSLHEENKYSNAFPPFEAMVFCADLKAKALVDYAKNMPHVYYHMVPGNHWRYNKQIMWKLPTETSDWVIGNLIKNRLENVPNITINIPRAWSTVVDIKGWGFSLNHGYTDAKGGFGGISWYSQQKSDSKRTAIDQRLGRDVHYRVYGHIHVEAAIGRTVKGQIITIPSLKGGDEYAKEGLAGTYSDAGQMLWGVHANRGKTWEYMPLEVTGYDRNDLCRYE